MKILGIIPARGGSKGVPRKNIKLLNGKPLLQYTCEIALKSSLIDMVILSSDDDEIIRVAKSLSIEVPFKRPDDLATDKSPTLSVILHALGYYRSIGKEFDAVCLLRVTSPFRTVAFLDKAIQTFIEKGTESLVSVQEVPHEYNPHWTFEPNEKGELQIATGEKEVISRRQELPKSYHRDGSIYLTKVEVLEQQQSLFGKSIAYIESPKDWYVNIDTIEDWQRAEQMLKNIS